MRFLEYLWQLPQNIVGILWFLLKRDHIIAAISNEDIKAVGAKAYLINGKGTVTLGKYVFINQTYEDRASVIKHECGHVRQSKILGPLYLIIIGIPSVLHAWLNSYIGCCEKHEEGYYHFYTEHILMRGFDNRDTVQ